MKCGVFPCIRVRMNRYQVYYKLYTYEICGWNFKVTAGIEGGTKSIEITQFCYITENK